MRLLVACPKCQRQYDASGRKVGEKFRCHCGAVLRVRQPRGHDAAVVRCSSCGGPREEGARKCGYCHADFTLHERDLDTVCPACLARVGDQARFCHHCGVGLVPEFDAGSTTKLFCPACDPKRMLTSRRLGYEKVTVLECGGCAGLWLGRDGFEQLVDRVAKSATEELIPSARQVAGPADDPEPPPIVEQGRKKKGKRTYRPCIVCGDFMVPRHYGRSGVVLDLCRDHGIWFDTDELKRVLRWVRRNAKAEKVDVESAFAGKKLPPPPPVVSEETVVLRPGNPFLDAVLDALTRRDHWF